MLNLEKINTVQDLYDETNNESTGNSGSSSSKNTENTTKGFTTNIIEPDVHIYNSYTTKNFGDISVVVDTTTGEEILSNDGSLIIENPNGYTVNFNMITLDSGTNPEDFAFVQDIFVEYNSKSFIINTTITLDIYIAIKKNKVVNPLINIECQNQIVLINDIDSLSNLSNYEDKTYNSYTCKYIQVQLTAITVGNEIITISSKDTAVTKEINIIVLNNNNVLGSIDKNNNILINSVLTNYINTYGSSNLNFKFEFQEKSILPLFNKINYNNLLETNEYIIYYSQFLTENNIAPFDKQTSCAAKNIGVYNGSVRIGYLELNNGYKDENYIEDDPLYSFIVISNPYINTSTNNLNNALSFLKQFNPSFITIIGNIINTNSEDTTNSLSLYNTFINSYDFPIYTIKSVTDNKIKDIDNNIWQTNLSEQNLDKLIFFDGNTYSNSYYFENNDDVFIILGDDNITKLIEILNKYTDKRCFLFVYNNLPYKAGDTVLYGKNQTNNIDKTTYQHTYTAYDIEFYLKLNEINNTYKNVIYISGGNGNNFISQRYFNKQNVCNIQLITDEQNKDGTNILTNECGWSLYVPPFNNLKQFYLQEDGSYKSLYDEYNHDCVLITVYKNHIIYKGFDYNDDLESCLFEPSAIYKLDSYQYEESKSETSTETINNAVDKIINNEYDVESITLSYNGTVITSLNISQIKDNPITIDYTILPDAAKYNKLTWYSDNTHIVTVDDNGTITYVSNGNCVVYCRYIKDNEILAEKQLLILADTTEDINNADNADDNADNADDNADNADDNADNADDNADNTDNIVEVAISELTLSSHELTIEQNDVINIYATLTPDNTTDNEVIWKYDENYCECNIDGLACQLKALDKIQSFTIMCICKNDEAYYDTCIINIVETANTDINSDDGSDEYYDYSEDIANISSDLEDISSGLSDIGTSISDALIDGDTSVLSSKLSVLDNIYNSLNELLGTDYKEITKSAYNYYNYKVYDGRPTFQSFLLNTTKELYSNLIVYSDIKTDVKLADEAIAISYALASQLKNNNLLI